MELVIYGHQRQIHIKNLILILVTEDHHTKISATMEGCFPLFKKNNMFTVVFMLVNTY